MSLPKSLRPFIWHFIKQQKRGFLGVLLLSFAWSLDNTVWPYLFKIFIDKIIDFNLPRIEIWTHLAPILGWMAGLWLLIELMFRLKGFLMARVFPKLEAAIRMTMFSYVAQHSYEFFANNFAGNVSNKISDMAQSSTRILQLILTLFVPALLALIIACGLFFTINTTFALMLGGWAVLHLGICLLSAKRCSRLADIHSTSRSELTGKIVDVFTSIINVKLFARQSYEVDYINRYQQDEQRKNSQANIAVEQVQIILGLSAFLFPGVLITWYEIYCWQHNLLTVGGLILIFNTTWNIMSLIWHAGFELPNLFKEIGTCQQALTIIKAEHDIKDKPNARALPIKHGEIAFNRVTFHYDKGGKIFKDMTVKIAAGSKVGLVGFTGSGKSSFVNLIMRFYDVHEGSICIDGLDIRDVAVHSLRRQISMVPQNPSLFHRSIRENIGYGDIQANEEQIMAAAKHAHCHEFINQLPQGYDALVGERGIKLSGGQRQRVAIARAILENAPILILDEATSALDSVTEKYIQDALHYLMQGRTTLVIAHRLSTLAEMDRILVFDHGKIVEDGKPDDLLKQNGHYAMMWHMQVGGFLPFLPDTPENLNGLESEA